MMAREASGTCAVVLVLILAGCTPTSRAEPHAGSETACVHIWTFQNTSDYLNALGAGQSDPALRSQFAHEMQDIADEADAGTSEVDQAADALAARPLSDALAGRLKEACTEAGWSREAAAEASENIRERERAAEPTPSTRTSPTGWRTAFGVRESFVSSPAVADDRVFIGSSISMRRTTDNDGVLHALDARTGRELWRMEADGAVETVPAVAEGTVYAGSFDGNVYAVDVGTGERRWVFEATGPVDSSPLVVEDVVFFGSRGRYLKNEGGYEQSGVYGVRARDGHMLWRFRTEASVFAAPTHALGTVYIGDSDGGFYAIEASTGRLRWSVDLGDSIWEGAWASGDGIVFVPGGTLRALDTADGSTRWEVKDEDGGWGSVSVANRLVYAATANSFVALAPATGARSWEVEFPDVQFIEGVVSGEVAYVVVETERNASGATGSFLVALDAIDGSELWRLNNEDHTEFGGPPAVADGTVYIGEDDGSVRAYDPEAE